jgi:TP901 family phage tail tape measure protein
MSYDAAELVMKVNTQDVARAERELKRFGATTATAGTRASRAAVSIGKMTAALGAIGASAAAGAALNRAIQNFHNLSGALAEVSTLIEGTPQQMRTLNQEVLRLSNAYGGTATQNAKAFYQALSAGAKGVVDAAKTVEQANKLAVGGVTTVEVAIDGLTSAMNAYKASSLTAQEASDAMFVGMRLGKTTIGELSASLGRVAPLAQQAGLSFDELVAAVSITTKSGIQTSEAVSGMKAALANIINPGEAAQRMAKELGIQFNAAALETMGFVGFIDQIRKATGGSSEALTQLFGSIEGANVVMALAGTGFDDLTSAMGEFANKAGETEAAYEKMAESLPQQLKTAQRELENMGLGLGKLGLELQVFTTKALVEFAKGWQDAFSDQGEGIKSVEKWGARFEKEMKKAGSDIGNLAKLVKNVFAGEWKATWDAAADVVDASVTRQESSLARLGRSVKAWADGLFASGLGPGGAPLMGAQQISSDMAAAGQGWAMEAGVAIPEGMAQGIDISTNVAKAAAARSIADIGRDMKSDAAAVGKAAGQAIAIEMGKGVSSRMKQITASTSSTMKKVDAEVKKTNESARSAAAARYKGATVGNGFGQQDVMGRTTMTTSIAKNDPNGFPSLLREYSEEIKKSWTDIRRDLERFAEQNTFDVNSFFSGSANSPGYWENFKNLAVDAWTGILTEAFSANGVGMTAMLKGVEGIFSKMNNLYNEAAARFMGGEKKTIDVVIGPGVKYAGMRVATLPVIRRGTHLWRRANVFTGGFVDYEDVDSGVIGRIGGNNSNAIARAYGVFKQFTPDVIKDLSTGPGSAEDQRAQKNGGKTPPFSLSSIDYAGDVAAPEITLSDRVGTSYAGTIDVRYRKEITGIAEVRQLLVEAAADVREPLKMLGDIIGGSTERLWEITEDFSISLGKTGKDTSNVQAELTAAFESYSEQIAGRILSHNETFRLAGETWTDALERLGKDFVSVTNTFLMLGQKSHQSATLWNAKVKSEVAQLFGGADEFSSAASSYFDVAYSPAEQASQLRKYAKSTLSGLGISNLPDSRTGYRNLVEAQDLNDSVGRERYAALIQLSDIFDFILPEFVDAVDDLGDTVVDDLSEFDAAMRAVAEGLTGMIRTADDAARTYERLSESIGKTADLIRGSGQSENQTFDILRNRFRDLKRDAMTGDLAAMEQIGDVATSYARAWGSRAETAAEYQWRTAKIATALENVAGVAANEAEMSRYESQSLEALLDAVDNGTLNNQLVAETTAAVGDLSDSIMNGLRTIYTRETGETPGFATGGRHRGGLRIVGERGPEIEATGPSQIYSTTASRGMLGIDELRRDMREQHAENLSFRIRMDKNIRLMWETIEEWDQAGLPEERAS